ncbi:MAG: DUF2306 domain-containing protein [Pseudomonadota bacterium]
MSLLPILTASPMIQLHIAAALVALFLGPFALYRARRDRLHKVLGYTWVLAMAITALSSFFIHSFPVIGPFSPIHLLALFALWSLYEGMRHIFAGRVGPHRLVMRSLYWNGLIVAGLFNFLPGRTTNRVFFGAAPELGYVVMAIGLTGVVVLALRTRRAVAVVRQA